MGMVFDQFASVFREKIHSEFSSGETVELAVLVGEGADPDLVEAVRAATFPKTAGCRFRVAAFGARAGEPEVGKPVEAVIVVCGSDPSVFERVCAACDARGLAVLPICPPRPKRAGADEGDVGQDELGEPGPRSFPTLWFELGSWLLDTLPDKDGPLVAGLDCCREVAVLRIVGESSLNNAMAGALGFPGLPESAAIALGQACMALRIAVAYGLPLDRDRLADLAAALASTAAAGVAAKVVLDKTAIPKILVRAAVASLSTTATGLLVRTRCNALHQRGVSKGDIS